MTDHPLMLTSYARSYRRDVMRFVSEAQEVGFLHLHLDWSTIEEWIMEPGVPVFLAWQGEKLLGVMAGSPAQGHTAWIRMIAVHEVGNLDTIIRVLWEELSANFAAQGVTEIGALILRPWIAQYLAPLGFAPHDNIVTLRREEMHVPTPLVRGSDVSVVDVGWHNVPEIVAIDHAAFDPMWQLSLIALRQASREAASFTVAKRGDRILGYQLTTAYRDGAHLARLAVIPEAQGQGIGALLLSEMLNRFVRRGMFSATVNTQESNTRSQQLYRRYNFHLTSMVNPMWLYRSE
jgi:ribosomal-protein-alanine N-acetyltransferase